MAKVFCIFLFIFLVTIYAYPNNDLDSNVSIDFLVNNDDTMKGIFDCILDRGVCNIPIVGLAKDKMESVIKTDCANCSPFRKLLFKQFVRKAETKFPKELASVFDKYDKDAEHRKHFMDFIHKD